MKYALQGMLIWQEQLIPNYGNTVYPNMLFNEKIRMNSNLESGYTGHEYEEVISKNVQKTEHFVDYKRPAALEYDRRIQR